MIQGDLSAAHQRGTNLYEILNTGIDILYNILYQIDLKRYKRCGILGKIK
jgi:hypothetical protein